jgi:beta-galactosidase
VQFFALARCQTKKVIHRNGEPWRDVNGDLIQAHGGGMLVHEGTYYWYGENKGHANAPLAVHPNGWQIHRTDVIGVSCYSSRDLVNWKHEGIVLKAVPDDENHVLHPTKVAERPKVIFHAPTRKFVMRLHLDSPDYLFAAQGIAISDSPVGPFTYMGSEHPAGLDSRDMTMIQMDDRAFTIFSTEDNKTLAIVELDNEFLYATNQVTLHFAGEYREAPAPFFAHGEWWMFSSGCTGWDPNEARADRAPALTGPWHAGENPCVGEDAEKTFYLQSTYVFEVNGRHVAMFDRWRKEDLQHSGYAWFWVEWQEGRPVIRWTSEWSGIA